MNEALISLTDALRRRMAVVADRGWYERDADSHLDALAEASREIDRSSEVVLRDTTASEKLKHYLVKKSYTKALQFIETGEASE